MKIIISILISFTVTALISGCSNTSGTTAMEITPKTGIEKVSEGALLLDVRTPEEFHSGHVTQALNIPHDTILTRLSEIGDDKNREIVVYCRSGKRAKLAQEALNSQGYKNVFVAGGYEGWLAAANKN